MGTGYTNYIRNGDITTGKDFLKLCTRNFCIAMDIRDESLSVPTPTHFEPNHYYEKYYKESVEKLNKYKKISFEEAKEEMIQKYIEKIKYAKKYLEIYQLEDEKYEKIRSEVKKWIPPTSEHENIKKFALEQIDMSMNTSLRKKLENNLEEKLDLSIESVYRYIRKMKDYYSKDVECFYKRWQEDLKQTAENNMWMKQFLDSLENI